MAVKSIIDVEVNDEQFKAFNALFTKYQEALKSTPDAWKQAGEAVGESKADIVTMTSALLAQNELLHKQTNAHNEIANAIHKTENSFTNLTRSSKRVLDHISAITFSLLKWSTLTGTVGALMGFGGLFGYEALARSAGQARTSAMGLGVTPGQLQAANIVYGNKLGDAGGILSHLADTQQDIGKSAKMSALLGIPRKDVESKNAAELMPEFLEALQQRLKNIPNAQLGTMSRALGLTDYASLSDLRILKGMSPEELKTMGRLAPQTARDVGGNLETDRKYQDFLTKLGTATQKAENSVIDALAPLAGPLGDIIKSFADDVGLLFKNPAIKQGMEDFASWLAAIPDTLGKPETKQAFVDFAEGLVTVAKDLKAFVLWFKPKEEQPLTPEQKKLLNDQMMLDTPGAFIPSNYRDDDAAGVHVMNAAYHPGRAPSQAASSGGFSSLENQYGLPAGLLQSTMMAESGGDVNAVSSAGAVGPFQFMPDTAKRFGLTNSRDVQQSAEAAARYFQQLIQKFHGNVEQAVASYNWGEGNVMKDIQAHGRNWKQFLPKETSNYVPRVVGGLSNGTAPLPPGGMTLRVYNQTGGSIVASASAMGPIAV